MLAPIFLRTPEDTFNAVFAAISQARTEILFQCYKIQDDTLGKKILQILTDKALAGVRVRVIYDRDSYIPANWWDTLERAGGRVQIFQRSWFDKLAHEHTKCVMVDGTVICGGCNFQEAWLHGWCDYDVQVTGSVITDAKAHFNSSVQDIRPKEGLIYSAPLSYVLSSSLQGVETVDKHLAKLIDRATKQILIASWFFLPSKVMHNALVQALQHGVKVTIVVALPKGFEAAAGWGVAVQGAWKAQRHYLQVLKAAGANVVACTGKYWHGKVLLVDDYMSVFGSYNFNVVEAATRTSNLSIALRFRPLVKEVRAYHDTLLAGSDFEPLPESNWIDALWHYGIRSIMFVLKYLTKFSPKY